MLVMKMDLEDGRGLIEVVVKDEIVAQRIKRFCVEAAQGIRDAERWRYIEKMMVYERCGPNYGWTIGDLTLDGDDGPAEAVDAAIARKERNDYMEEIK